MRGERRSRGFTLVELLVVIGIIAILIALLIGPISSARRRALVLACPIATRTTKDASILVSPTGGAELQVSSWPSVGDNDPEWSTNGTWIGFSPDGPPRGPLDCDAVIVHVMSGKARYFGEGHGWFMGWADDDHYISHEPPAELLTIREAASFRVTETYNITGLWGAYAPRSVKRVPPSTGAYYIATLRSFTTNATLSKVVLLRKDFSIKKVVFRAYKDGATGNSETFLYHASVDPTGEYAAWTGSRTAPGLPGGGVPRVAIKALNSPSSDSPLYIPPADWNSSAMVFCDWTENGNILAFVWNGNESLSLVIMTRTGRMVRTIRQDKASFYPYASYRKYMHQ